MVTPSLPSSAAVRPPVNVPVASAAVPVAPASTGGPTATSILNAVGGQKTLSDVYNSIGGQAGIEAIYNSLGGRDAVMKMIQSGQGLPANFQLPQQLRDLGKKLESAARTQRNPTGGGSYDYEYYYVDDSGNEITAPGSSSFPPASSISSSSAPASPSYAGSTSTSLPALSATPASPSTPLFAPPNPSFVAGGGSLFDFLENDEEPSKPSVSAPTPAPATKSLSERLAAAQSRIIG